MAITFYDTVEGEMISERTSGVQTDYFNDPLGTPVCFLDDTPDRTEIGIFRAKPYGDTLYTNGFLTKFRWVGSRGYRNTGLAWSDYYMRARHYGSENSTLTTSSQSQRYNYLRNPTTTSNRIACNPEPQAIWATNTSPETFMAPNPCNCPNIQWKINWALLSDDPCYSEGAVIQQGKFTIEQSSCSQDGKPSCQVTSTIQNQNYWEAWPVRGGKAGPTCKKNGDNRGWDYFWMTQPQGCVKGTMSWVAHVGYYAGKSVCGGNAPIKPWTYSAPSDFPNGLLWVNNPSKSPVEPLSPPQIEHSLVVDYDCCKKPGELHWKAVCPLPCKGPPDLGTWPGGQYSSTYCGGKTCQ